VAEIYPCVPGKIDIKDKFEKMARLLSPTSPVIKTAVIANVQHEELYLCQKGSDTSLIQCSNELIDCLSISESDNGG
jgi:hypothetical protein